MKSFLTQELKWNQITNIDNTKEIKKVIYVLTYKGQVQYVGKALRLSGAKARYSYGYAYLFRLLLKAGFSMFVSQELKKAWFGFVEDVERTLILECGVENEELQNRRKFQPRNKIRLKYNKPWKKTSKKIKT